jgi:SOS-response transcriptional repressor LexA
MYSEGRKIFMSSKNDKTASSGQEFFELPRAESLIEDVQNSRNRQMGDLVTNTTHRLSNRFTLVANDNCMKDADIREGDYMVIEKKSSYTEGSILAVQLGSQKLIRRYFRAGGRIHLQCDPPSRQIIIVEEHTPDFQILGQVIQIIREIR